MNRKNENRNRVSRRRACFADITDVNVDGNGTRELAGTFRRLKTVPYDDASRAPRRGAEPRWPRSDFSPVVA